MASSTVASLSVMHVVSRVAASLVGGWVFVWGLTSLGIALGVLAGAEFHDAMALMYLLAFLVFLFVFCWSFAARSLALVWLVLAGGGAVMTAVAWMLVPALTH